MSTFQHYFNNKYRVNHRKPKPILCASLTIIPKPIKIQNIIIDLSILLIASLNVQ